MNQNLAEAWRLFAEGKHAQVERLLNPIIKSAPKLAHARYLRALARLAQNKPEAALNDINAVEQAPDLAHGLVVARARALMALQRWSEARLSLEAAIDLKEDDPFCHHLMGVCMQNLDDAAQAMAAFRRAVRLQPDMAATHYEMGTLALAGGDVDTALQALGVAATLWPDQAVVQNNLGLAQSAASLWGEAVASLTRATEIDARYAEAWFNLALALRQRGDEAAANVAHAKAVKCKPELAELAW